MLAAALQASSYSFLSSGFFLGSLTISYDIHEFRPFSGFDNNFQNHPNTKAVRIDWRERTKTMRPVLAEQRANLAGIGRIDVANTVREGFQGRTVGLYREGDLLLPVVLRAPEAQRHNVESINQLQIWSPSAQRMIPLRQVVEGFETSYADEIIIRRDRKRTLTVYADPISGSIV